MSYLRNVGRYAPAAMLLAVLTVPSVTLACPMCEVALKGDPLVAAFDWTTLFMLVVPALLMVSIGGWVGYTYWRAGRRQDATAWSAQWIEAESES